MHEYKPEHYTRYVGDISVKEFIEPFKDCKRPTVSAICDLVEFWPWEDPVPPYFDLIIYMYCRNVMNNSWL